MKKLIKKAVQSAEKIVFTLHFCVLSAVILFMILPGCSLFVSDAKYEADKEMWKAKSLAIIEQSKAANKPLATFKTANNEIFIVNNPNVMPAMLVTGEPNAFVQGLDVVLNSWLAKLFGGGYLADKILGGVQGNYSAGDGSSISVTRDSGNPVTVETKHIEGDGTISEESHLASDNVDTATTSDNRENYDNATATPTVVTQPAPLVVNPVVVNPLVVDPVVVTQPAPIIVNQTTE